MSYLGWLDIVLISIGLGISATPAYKAYRYSLWQRFGYWNVLVLPMLMLIANIFFLLIKNIIGIILFIPLDIVALISAVFTYFKIKKIRNNK